MHRYDGIVLLYYVSLGLFFIFVKLEFARMRDHELYALHVNTMQQADERRIL